MLKKKSFLLKNEEPHYMLCGIPVEEHCSRVNHKLFTEQYKN